MNFKIKISTAFGPGGERYVYTVVSTHSGFEYGMFNKIQEAEDKMAVLQTGFAEGKNHTLETSRITWKAVILISTATFVIGWGLSTKLDSGVTVLKSSIHQMTEE